MQAEATSAATFAAVRHPGRWLLAIVLLGLGLRLWQTGWGLPYNYQVSEPMYTYAAQSVELVGWHKLHPLFSFYQEILLLERWVVGLLLPVLDRLALSPELAATLHSWMLYHLLGRFTNALAGALTAVPIFLIGWRARDARTGLLAALFWAVCFLSVRNSHFAKPDATTCLLATSAAYLCTRLSPRRPAVYAGAGLLAGLAISTKLLAWPLLVVMLLFQVLAWRRDRAMAPPAGDPAPRRPAARLLPPALGFLAVAVGFCAGSPQALLRFHDVVTFWKWVSAVGKEGGMDRFDIRFGHPSWQIYLNAFDWGLGIALLVLCAAGVAWLAYRRRPVELLLLLAFPLLLYGFLLLPGNMAHDRYVMMGVPYLLLAAANLLTELPARRRIAPAWATAGLILAVVAAIAQPLCASVLYDRVLGLPDTRTVAKKWIEENVPAGAHIALEVMWYCPQLSSAEVEAPLSTRQYQASFSGAYGLSERSRMTGRSLGVLTVEDYRRHGVEYIVTDGYSRVLRLIDPEQERRRREFYSELDTQATLVHEVSPLQPGESIPFFFDQVYGPVVEMSKLAGAGPAIRIYRLTPPAPPAGLGSFSKP